MSFPNLLKRLLIAVVLITPCAFVRVWAKHQGDAMLWQFIAAVPVVIAYKIWRWQLRLAAPPEPR